MPRDADQHIAIFRRLIDRSHERLDRSQQVVRGATLVLAAAAHATHRRHLSAQAGEQSRRHDVS